MSSTALRHGVRALVTMALLAAIAALGQIPYGSVSEEAALRLALRTVGGRVEVCRDRTPQEIEALPTHMRTPRVCTERPVSFRLTVAIGGREILDETVSPGGLRGDRPLIADRLLPLAPGAAQLRVDFRPRAPEALSPEERQAFEALPSYRLEREVDFEAGRILLVTLDGAAERLRISGER